MVHRRKGFRKTTSKIQKEEEKSQLIVYSLQDGSRIKYSGNNRLTAASTADCHRVRKITVYKNLERESPKEIKIFYNLLKTVCALLQYSLYVSGSKSNALISAVSIYTAVIFSVSSASHQCLFH